MRLSLWFRLGCACVLSHWLSVQGESYLGLNWTISSLPENESSASECIFISYFLCSFQRLQYIQICGVYWHSRAPFKWRELTHLLGPVFFRLFPETCLSDQYSARNTVLLALEPYSQRCHCIKTLMQSKLASKLYSQSTSVFSPYFVCF